MGEPGEFFFTQILGLSSSSSLNTLAPHRHRIGTIQAPRRLHDVKLMASVSYERYSGVSFLFCFLFVLERYVTDEFIAEICMRV
jgi:hypothetical protein